MIWHIIFVSTFFSAASAASATEMNVQNLASLKWHPDARIRHSHNPCPWMNKHKNLASLKWHPGAMKDGKKKMMTGSALVHCQKDDKTVMAENLYEDEVLQTGNHHQMLESIWAFVDKHKYKPLLVLLPVLLPLLVVPAIVKNVAFANISSGWSVPPPTCTTGFGRSHDMTMILKKFTGNRFHVCYGSHATGKTELIKQMLRERNGGGVLYICIQEGVDTSLEEIASKTYTALSCTLANYDVFRLGKKVFEEVPSKFTDVFGQGGLLDSVSSKYREHSKQRVIFVIDGANSLKDDVLGHVLAMAKRLADQGDVSMVFVSTAGKLPHLLTGTSALTRGAFHMIRQPDKEVLRQHFKTEPATFERLHELMGSKITNLQAALEDLKFMTIEEIELKHYHESVYYSFALSGLWDKENAEWVAKLFKSMLKTGKIPVTEFHQIVPAKDILRVNSGNVFTIDDAVSFECKSHEIYATVWLHEHEQQQQAGREQVQNEQGALPVACTRLEKMPSLKASRTGVDANVRKG